ncbi:MAG: FAD-dependent oxidoreductase [Planctomycetota bacterium]|nr:FAD-dependent oxidoreductase [Planctomycetota bacterium]
MTARSNTVCEERSPTLFEHAKCACSLLFGLRRHDLRAARTFVSEIYAGQPALARWGRFVCWSLGQMFSTIPVAMRGVSEAKPVDRTPIWLATGNPLANHPWNDRADAALPEEADTVVIGAGFTGASVAYHWAKKATTDRELVLLDMDDPADGASGRNEGLVVMGRYFAMVHASVLADLRRTRDGLSESQRERLAKQFAKVYCTAAYKNGDMIEETVRAEGFDCDYARKGWVQERTAQGQRDLDASVAMGRESGCEDWTKLTPREVLEKTGMRVESNSGFSVAAATFHPAKWVWSLLEVAIEAAHVNLFTRTKVLRVEDAGENYIVHTTRGPIRACHVVNATESFTPLLHKQFHDIVQPTQTQAAFAKDGPHGMKPHIGISSSTYFCGRHGDGMLFGSDATRIPDHEVGRNQPSRFLTRFILGQLKRGFGPFQAHLTNEWSGTVGYTPDGFPLIGLIDGKRQYLIAGMAGSGTAFSFNGGRWVCDQILGIAGEDDYPDEYFSPTRLLDPKNHNWPQIEETSKPIQQ